MGSLILNYCDMNLEYIYYHDCFIGVIDYCKDTYLKLYQSHLKKNKYRNI